jgi:hypothetical protein
MWPDELPTRIADRVQAAMWRRSQGLPPPTREVEPEGGVR